MKAIDAPSIPQRLLVALLVCVVSSPALADDTEDPQRPLFMEAWQSARVGDRSLFTAAGPRLEDYILYPYWQYEDYRHRRASVPPDDMAQFLAGHEDWAFTTALRRAWLKALGKRRNWAALRQYGAAADTDQNRCYHARARLAAGDNEGLVDEARTLWTVGRSQPDACDPLFEWFIDQGGVTTDVAWRRIDRVMASGNRRLTVYLSRFLPPADRDWLMRWQKLDRGRYAGLERAASWPDTGVTRMITATSLGRLIKRDPGAAIRAFDALDGHFNWSEAQRGGLMREIALMAAVDLDPGAEAFLKRVPAPWADDQLLQWWARLRLARGDWEGLLEVIGRMPAETVDDDRWRYWKGVALDATGQTESAGAVFDSLATETHYYAFLAADRLDRAYTICPLPPAVDDEDVERIRSRPDFRRALELHQVDLDSWARSEWARATARLDTGDLRAAAALARQEHWHDRTIFALGDSGDLRWYEWRFPMLWEQQVAKAAGSNRVDPAWIYGVMRSESAMMETARSSANAMGLMQITPGTARLIANKHGLSYNGSAQLMDGGSNIRLGAVHLRDLLDEYGQNPVLVSGAYNAGPHVVDRWLGSRPRGDAAVWVETLPYYETRDYIPRVLAFTAIYDWRMAKPVRRVSSRMPDIESGTIAVDETTEVECRAGPAELAADSS